jgi:hypothetical protein
MNVLRNILVETIVENSSLFILLKQKMKLFIRKFIEKKLNNYLLPTTNTK